MQAVPGSTPAEREEKLKSWREVSPYQTQVRAMEALHATQAETGAALVLVLVTLRLNRGVILIRARLRRSLRW